MELFAHRLNHRSGDLAIVKIQDVDGHQNGQRPPCCRSLCRNRFSGRDSCLLLGAHGRQWYQIAASMRARTDGAYFRATLPLSTTMLEGISGFKLSSAVMSTSKSLYVVVAFRLPSRFPFTLKAPSNSGSLPRGWTQTR
jgi:hypothetical protein